MEMENNVFMTGFLKVHCLGSSDELRTAGSLKAAMNLGISLKRCKVLIDLQALTCGLLRV